MSTYVVVEGGVPRCQSLGESECSEALKWYVRICFVRKLKLELHENIASFKCRVR